MESSNQKLVILIIGAGNLAVNLIENFTDKGFDVGVSCRNKSSFDLLKSKYPAIFFEEKIFSLSKKYEYIFLAVSDTSISRVSQSIENSDAAIIHCSGATELNVINTHSNYGVFYPLQTLSSKKPVSFKEVPILVEANNEFTLKKLVFLAQLVSDFAFEVSSEKRLQYHLSAVIANNFVNHLVYLSKQILNENHLNSQLLNPLLKSTFDKILNENVYKTQTGPARRGDDNTLNKHLQILDSEKLKDIYLAITQSIKETYKNEF